MAMIIEEHDMDRICIVNKTKAFLRKRKVWTDLLSNLVKGYISRTLLKFNEIDHLLDYSTFEYS